MSDNSKNKKTKKEKKPISPLNQLIIDEAVKQYKEGKIKSGLDVENFLDGLLQPLMQKLLDAELENHLDYPKYAHVKDSNNARNGH